MTKYSFNVKKDARGSLIAIEENRDIPFNIKRIYYMYGIETGANRGCHAHKLLQQILICINGECSISLDNGFEKEIFVLSGKENGLYIPPKVWHEIYGCSGETIILALASEYYDEADYIRDYGDFKKYISYSKKDDI